MSAARSSRPTPPATFTAVITTRGHELAFRLCTRPLTLGGHGTVQYYWMDSSQFRIARSRRGGDPANFRNCLSHWWLTMESMGLGDDPTQLEHLILANSYAVVSRSNGLQHVYRD